MRSRRRRLSHHPRGRPTQGDVAAGGAARSRPACIDHPASPAASSRVATSSTATATRTDSIGHGTHIAGIVARRCRGPGHQGARRRATRARRADARPRHRRRRPRPRRTSSTSRSTRSPAAAANDAASRRCGAQEQRRRGRRSRAGRQRLAARLPGAGHAVSSTLCVGAVGRDFRLAPFSNYGRGLGLVGAEAPTCARRGRSAAIGASRARRRPRLRSAPSRPVSWMRACADPPSCGAWSPPPAISAPPATTRARASACSTPSRALDGGAGRRPEVLRASSARRPRLADVRRHGLRVRCDAARPGICRVNLRVRGRTIATGRRRVSGARAGARHGPRHPRGAVAAPARGWSHRTPGGRAHRDARAAAPQSCCAPDEPRPPRSGGYPSPPPCLCASIPPTCSSSPAAACWARRG